MSAATFKVAEPRPQEVGTHTPERATACFEWFVRVQREELPDRLSKSRKGYSIVCAAAVRNFRHSRRSVCFCAESIICEVPAFSSYMDPIVRAVLFWIELITQ